MTTKIGTRLYSTVCAAEVIVVRAPVVEVDITCGGQPMVSSPITESSVELAASPQESGAVLGKRYEDEQSGLELLVTKGGAGTLAASGRDLTVKEAKRLPASD